MENSQGFISAYNSSVPAAQRKAIDALIDEKRRQGFIVTKGQQDSTIELLNTKLVDGKFFKYEQISKLDTITTDFFNQHFGDILLDLKALYAQIGVIDSDRSKIAAVTNDSFIKTKAAVNVLINQLRLFRFLKNNPEYQDAKFVSFNEAFNKTGLAPAAFIDPKIKTLRLPVSTQNRFAAGRFNLDRTTVEVNHFGGGVRGSNKDFAPENSIDTNPDNFWADIVLTDGLPSHKVKLSHNYNHRALASGIQNGHEYTSNGIVFEVKYTFYRTVRTNNIKIQPIADYPVRVLDIAYKTSSLSSDWITVPDFDPESYEEGLEWIEWSGRRIHLTELRIVLEQQNYTTNIYHIPTDIVANNQLWSQIVDKTYNELIHNIAIDEVLAEKIQADPNLLALLNEEFDLKDELAHQNLSGKNPKLYDFIERTKAIIASQSFRTDNLESIKQLNSIDGIKLYSSAPLTEIKKLQFICGIRVLEVNDIQYEPYGVYESQKFETNANPLEVSLETNEVHVYQPDGLLAQDYKNTSIEYELEIAPNTRVPIAPYNNVYDVNDNRVVVINEEILIPNDQYLTAIVRFPVSNIDRNIIPVAQIRKNGTRVSPLILNSTSIGDAKYNYTLSYVTVNGYNYIKCTFNSTTFDPRAVYTISYIAHIDAAVIDINRRFDSLAVTAPETFTKTDRDNKVTVSFYPYIEYTIVNNENIWKKREIDEVWEFLPALANYSLGRVTMSTGTPYTITGNGTFWENAGLRDAVTGGLYGLTGASIQFAGDINMYPISGILSNSGITLSQPVDFGFLPSGTLPTGMQYTIGRTVTIDGDVYGLYNTTYEPVMVYVNDIKATNKTNYTTLEHEAFIPQDNTRIYQFIQAGKNIFFNAPIDGSIEVYYKYMSQYLKVNALLRNHSVVNPVETPILEDYTIRIKNSKI